jgi:hypothetical protein
MWSAICRNQNEFGSCDRASLFFVLDGEYDSVRFSIPACFPGNRLNQIGFHLGQGYY